MRGLNKKINSNRDLAKRYKTLNRISFCSFKTKYIHKISEIGNLPFDLHDFYPTENSYIYRAITNKNSDPHTSINWIRFNPNPSSMSRANIKNQGVAYYACAPDIVIIESCIDKLKKSNDRKFELTLSKWKIKKKISYQIVCNSLKAQSAGTDLDLYSLATNRKRKKELKRKHYRTYFLKTRFLADQYAKNVINCDNDYYISAKHAKTLLNHPDNIIDGIIYPSVQYFYKGYNYAFAPRLFDDSYFEIEEVMHVVVEFNKDDIYEYPKWEIIKTTKTFDNDQIIW